MPLEDMPLTRRELTLTLKHFPGPKTIDLMATGDVAIALWLLPADHYR